MPPRPTRYFLCTGECIEYKDLYKYPNSHIIGHLRLVVDEGRRVTSLARWEASVQADRVPPVSPLIDCDFIGDARNIKCRFDGCKNTVRWEIGKAAFEQLMKRYGGAQTPADKRVDKQLDEIAEQVVKLSQTEPT